MKRQTLLKSTLCLLMALVCNVTWAQTATIEKSTSVDSPEHMYEIKSGSGYWMTSYTSPTNTNPGRFAFFATDVENAYKIYSIDQQKWVSYTIAASYSNGTNKAVLVGTKDEANAWCATIVTVSSVKYYQFAPYKTDASIASIYANWYQGVGSNPLDNTSTTIGLYGTGASGDSGSRWTLYAYEAATEEEINNAKNLIKVAPGYPKTSSAAYTMLNDLTSPVSKSFLTSIVTAYKTATDIILPENGKAYTLTSVMGNAADATRYYMKYEADKKVAVSKTESDASIFVCKELSTINANEKRYAFVTVDGKFLTWIGNNEDGAYKENGQILGYSSNYATTYNNKADWNEITIKKNGTSADDLGYLRLVGRRSSSSYSSIIANSNNRFDQSGDSYYFNNGNSSAWILTEVEYINTAAQDLALAKIDAKVQVAANAAKLGEGIGYASYTIDGVKKYAAADINTAIDAATSLDAVNAIKNSYAMTLPEAGKAYTMTFVANNTEKTQYKIIASGTTLSASSTAEAGSVFYCIKTSNADYPYVFISDEGKILMYNALTADYTIANNKLINNFKVESMADNSNGNITGDVANRAGMVCITTPDRSTSNTSDGCLILELSSQNFSNSSAPYFNGSYTSAIIMTEVTDYTANDAVNAAALSVANVDAKQRVAADQANLSESLVGYHYVVNGTKVYDVAAIVAAIDAATTCDEVAAILASRASNLPGYYYISSRAINRHEHLYNDATHTGNSGRTTLQSDTRVTANSGIWYITNLGNNKIGIKNGDGNPIVAKEGPTAGAYSELTIGSTIEADDILYYYFSDAALNCSNGGSYVINGAHHLTTWRDGGSSANDNQWRFDPVSVEGKTIYEVVVNGDANAYVAYNDGTTTQNAFNGGFFIADEPITEAQLKAGFAGSVVKSATITIEENVITVSDVEVFPTPEKIDLYNTSNGSLEVPPYRIPGITVDPETGRIITTAARLVCGTDPGYGQVDVVCRISDNHGDTWSEMKEVAVGTGITSPTVNYFDTAFGDPAVVADRTSDEVLIIVVAGCTKYQTATRAIPNEIGTIHSLDNGNTWGKPVRVTEQIYSLFDAVNGGNTIQSAFVGGGKIFQSRIVKVGQYYRLYAAMCARPNGNRVIYSDDFGRTWKALGGAAALPAPDGDEPKCEELPDGRVILSSRAGGGRIYNIYTYSNTETAEGSWGTDVKSTFAGSGKTPGGNSTNGEILIVPVQRNSDNKDMYLALQSLPTGGDRRNVGIFYKELTDLSDINNVANFAIDWNGFYQVSYTTSAYSSMDLQKDGRIGFIYEDNYTKHGEVSNPHSIPFPDANNLGTHNYDGYDNIYVAYPLEYITDGAYSIIDVDRREFLRSYFTDLTADAVDEVKAAVATKLKELNTVPTIDEVDNIYFTISKGSAVTAFDEHAGKAGFFTSEAVATYKTEVMAAMQPAGLAEAKAKLLASKLNIVSGKAYTFKNVQKDGTEYWFTYNATDKRIDLTGNVDEATPFVCRLLDNGKYVFVCNDGKYMTWRGSDTGNTGIRGDYDNTNDAYTDITIEKMTSGNNIDGDLSATRYVTVWGRRSGTDEGCMVVKLGGEFNATGYKYERPNDRANAPFYTTIKTGTFSSAFIMEEVEVLFGNAKVNNVEESKLMSEDLHRKSMSTFSATYATIVPEGVTAYYATKSGENVVLNAIAKDKAIPANTGVILVAEQGDNAVMLPSSGETAADVTGNLLVGSAGEAKDMSSVANAYILTGGEQGAGFYRCSGGTLAANKAYLQLESAQQALRIRLAGEQGGTTEVEMPTANGQQPTAVYDLQGRRVANPTKGMYIVNGKKVLF